ncbi:MAG TPA: AAA family ATPase [Gemmatimonadales bacterium]
MTERSTRTALISSDRGFREMVKDVFLSHEGWTAPALEITAPFESFGEEQVRALRQLHPDLVILDIAEAPDLGVKFAQFLSETTQGIRFIATGPLLQPEHMLAAMRAGVVDYLPKPVTSEAFHAALGRIRHFAGNGGKDAIKQPGQVYAFYSPKGGAGTTTTATNFAVILQRLTGKRTLLVDLDLELGEIALLLGVQPRFNFVDMVKNFHRMDAGLLASYIEQHSSGIHLLSAPFHPERAEVVSADDIRRILHFLKQHYDYVVVDTPGSFSPTTLAAFDQSDLVFVVTNLDLPSLRNIQRGLPMLKRVLPRGDEQIRMVVNRYSPDSQISLDDVQRTLGLKVFGTISNDYEALIQSINSGKPIVLNGTSKYTRDVKALGARIAGLSGDFLDEKRAGNWVGRVLGKLRRNPEEAKQ